VSRLTAFSDLFVGPVGDAWTHILLGVHRLALIYQPKPIGLGPNEEIVTRGPDGCLGHLVTCVADTDGPMVDFGIQPLVELGNFGQRTNRPTKQYHIPLRRMDGRPGGVLAHIANAVAFTFELSWPMIQDNKHGTIATCGRLKLNDAVANTPWSTAQGSGLAQPSHNHQSVESGRQSSSSLTLAENTRGRIGGG
jgi:hypothetical protein